MDFSAAGGNPIAVGEYGPATRYPFTPFTALSIAGMGTACNGLTGRFIVREVEYAPDGTVLRFAADAEQHCDDLPPGTFAAIRYNSTIADLVPFGDFVQTRELQDATPLHFDGFAARRFGFVSFTARRISALSWSNSSDIFRSVLLCRSMRLARSMIVRRLSSFTVLPWIDFRISLFQGALASRFARRCRSSWHRRVTQVRLGGNYSSETSSTRTMKTLVALTALLLTIAPAVAQTTNLTGNWTGTLTRTAPDGRTQSIDFMFVLTQKGKVLTGTAGPNPERQWTIEKGAVDGSKVTFQVQQPDGPLRTFTLKLAEGRLQGEMLAELKGQSFTAKVDAGRAKTK